MRLNDFTIDSGYGANNHLDNAYKYFLLTVNGLGESVIQRWEVYNMIADELLSLELYNKFEELKYRVTGKENPNSAIIDILDGIELTNLLHNLLGLVYGYLEEDKYSKFYI